HAREHAGVGPAGADRGEVLPGDLDRLFHLLLGFEEGFVDHGYPPSVIAVRPVIAERGRLSTGAVAAPSCIRMHQVSRIRDTPEYLRSRTHQCPDLLT